MGCNAPASRFAVALFSLTDDVSHDSNEDKGLRGFDLTVARQGSNRAEEGANRDNHGPHDADHGECDTLILEGSR